MRRRRRWRNRLKRRIFWLPKPKNADFNRTTSAMAQSTCPTPRQSSLNGKPILLEFDGVDMSSDAVLSVRHA